MGACSLKATTLPHKNYSSLALYIHESQKPMEEPPWKKIKLSLERPYKYDDCELIPVLQDITPEGIHINEPYVDFEGPG